MRRRSTKDERGFGTTELGFLCIHRDFGQIVMEALVGISNDTILRQSRSSVVMCAFDTVDPKSLTSNGCTLGGDVKTFDM